MTRAEKSSNSLSLAVEESVRGDGIDDAANATPFRSSAARGVKAADRTIVAATSHIPNSQGLVSIIIEGVSGFVFVNEVAGERLDVLYTTLVGEDSFKV